VVVVDDHDVMRAGLQAVLGREPDLHVVGSAANGTEALDVVEHVQPDAVVVDFSMPGMSGVEVCERLVARWPQLAVVMITNYIDDGVRARSLRAGARAHVHKSVDGTALATAVRRAAAATTSTTPPTPTPTTTTGDQPAHRVLSLRETDVLRLVANGASNKDVAAALGVRVNTVKTYVERTLDKLGCRTRSEAAAVAVKRGLL
jgi:DNA-binding NarL/FixJ family response regulator